MELIYALMIFFGAMTPNDYSTTMNIAFNPEIMMQTLQANQSIVDVIITEPDVAERIRMIDRTDD